MPRFYFHFREDGYTHMDEVGHELPNLEAAELEATATAAALLRDEVAKGRYGDICVEVSNAAGFPVVTVCASIKVQRKP